MKSLHVLHEMHISQRHANMRPPVLELARDMMQFADGLVRSAKLAEYIAEL